jgi:hypothetical protein
MGCLPLAARMRWILPSGSEAATVDAGDGVVVVISGVSFFGLYLLRVR